MPKVEEPRTPELRTSCSTGLRGGGVRMRAQRPEGPELDLEAACRTRSRARSRGCVQANLGLGLSAPHPNLRWRRPPSMPLRTSLQQGKVTRRLTWAVQRSGEGEGGNPAAREPASTTGRCTGARSKQRGGRPSSRLAWRSSQGPGSPRQG